MTPPFVEAPVAGVSSGPQCWLHYGPAGPQGGTRGAVGLAVVPGCFDQQPPHVGVAGFGDRSLDPRGSRGVFAGHQSDVGADRGAGKPRPVADLHRQRQAGSVSRVAWNLGDDPWWTLGGGTDAS